MANKDTGVDGTGRRSFLKRTVVATAGATGLAGCSSGGSSGGGNGGTTTGSTKSSGGNSNTTINAFLWEGYGGTVELFNEQHDNITVEFDRATSTSKMFQKTKAAPGQYDVVTPNSGYVRRFRDAGLIQPLADSQEALMELAPNYQDTFEYFQKGTLKNHLTGEQGKWYGTPIRFGAYGMTINNDELDPSIVGNGTNVNGIWENSEQLQDNVGVRAHPVHAIPYAVRALGYTDMLRGGEYIEVSGQAWEEVRSKFLELADITRAVFDSESQANKALASGAYNLAIGQGRNDTISLIQKSNKPYKFITPTGALSWTEGGLVTKESDKKEAAVEFLNFLLSPKAGAQLTKDDKAPSAAKGAKKHLTQEQVDLIYLPSEKVNSMVQDKPFKEPEKWKQLMNEFKTQL